MAGQLTKIVGFAVGLSAIAGIGWAIDDRYNQLPLVKATVEAIAVRDAAVTANTLMIQQHIHDYLNEKVIELESRDQNLTVHERRELLFYRSRVDQTQALINNLTAK